MRMLLEVGLIVSALFVLWGMVFSGKPIVMSEADGFTQAILILWAARPVVLLIMDRHVKHLDSAYRAWALCARVWGSFVFFMIIPEETSFIEETGVIQVMAIMWSLYTVTSMIMDRRRVKRLYDAYRSRVS